MRHTKGWSVVIDSKLNLLVTHILQDTVTGFQQDGSPYLLWLEHVLGMAIMISIQVGIVHQDLLLLKKQPQCTNQQRGIVDIIIGPTFLSELIRLVMRKTLHYNHYMIMMNGLRTSKLYRQHQKERYMNMEIFKLCRQYRRIGSIVNCTAVRWEPFICN